MKIQRLLIVLTILNLALLLTQLFQARPTLAQSVAPVLRGKGLEIVDDQGRIRASITVLPGSTANKQPFPETVILRLIDGKGKPLVKLAASEQGSVLGLLGDSEPTYARIEANGASTFVKLTNKDGHEQVVKP
ncbi:MAG: hypothetical protein DMG59_02360 [Acidobacteria bacterium]|nr:MAG: hypothetical protein DMG59_02360 [Acidobacteriota bacterium]